MPNEGVIKFTYKRTEGKYEISQRLFKRLNTIRQSLFEKKFIGSYSDGLSYGNISIRSNEGQGFIISASDTGKIAKTVKPNYVHVLNCDLERNFCTFKGAAKPSSESLSHHVIYSQIPDANAVIHIHNKEMWKQLKGQLPTTGANTMYGTVEMAKEIILLLQKGELQVAKILIMGGHEEGIIAFGESIEAAADVITQFEALSNES